MKMTTNTNTNTNTNTARWWLLAMVIGLAACGPVEHRQTLGQLEVRMPWSREVPAGAPVAAGYISIRNRGNGDDRLLAVRSEAAERVEIHEMRHEDGVARMRELPDGLPLPAGGTVELRPGGYHLMFIAPRAGFDAGARVPATLVFAGAGELAVEFEVRAVAASAEGPAHPHH